MPALIELQELPNAAVEVAAEDSVWEVWVGKARTRESRNGARRIEGVKWIAAAVLIATAALWARMGPYDVAIRFALTLAAVVVAFSAFQARRYAFGVLFGALAILYNPIAPEFAFAGGWQRVLVVLTAIAFVTSVAWRDDVSNPS